jgi:hypothetical protein
VAGLPEVVIFSDWLRTEARRTVTAVAHIEAEEKQLRAALKLPPANIA